MLENMSKLRNWVYTAHKSWKNPIKSWLWYKKFQVRHFFLTLHTAFHN